MCPRAGVEPAGDCLAMAVTQTPAPAWSGREDPEDGPAARRMHHLARQAGPRAVLGFACDAGVARNKGRVGAIEGPSVLRKAMANLAVPDTAPGFEDLGDVIVTGDDLEGGQTVLANAVSDALQTFERLVVLGGGHETAFGAYSGFRQAFPDMRIGILNLDAHLDLRALGPQGGSSGTPFTQIRALDPDRFDYLCVGYAAEANTVPMMDRARDWGVGLVEDRALIRDPRAAHDAIEALVARNAGLYLTIDIDVLSHFQAPGVSAPAARGLSFATVEGIVDHALAMCARHNVKLPLADLVELNPVYDRDGVTAKTAAILARRLMIDQSDA